MQSAMSMSTPFDSKLFNKYTNCVICTMCNKYANSVINIQSKEVNGATLFSCCHTTEWL